MHTDKDRHSTIGVLVMAYGTPQSLDEVEAYYTHIRRGKPPAKEQAEELVQRYKAIGGLSPLHEITRMQIEGIERQLNELKRERASHFRCLMGMKHARPFIEDTVKRMAEQKIDTLVGLVLAPHYSVMSVGGYIERARKAAEQHGIKRTTFIESWHLEPHYIQALSERVETTLQQFAEPESVKVLFTAHSLPQKILEMNDPYVAQLEETSEAIARRVHIRSWDFAWQSAGQTRMPWLGPDILDVMKDLHTKGVRNLIVCPIGFVSDHLEILYDIDIECQTLAKELGMNLKRTPSLNADPLFLKGLASVVLDQLPV